MSSLKVFYIFGNCAITCMFAVRHLQNRQENQVTLQFLFPDWCGFDFTISGTI